MPDPLNEDLERNYKACSSLEKKLFGEEAVGEKLTSNKTSGGYRDMQAIANKTCTGYVADAQALIRTYEQRIHYLKCLKTCVDKFSESCKE